MNFLRILYDYIASAAKAQKLLTQIDVLAPGTEAEWVKAQCKHTAETHPFEYDRVLEIGVNIATDLMMHDTYTRNVWRVVFNRQLRQEWRHDQEQARKNPVR